MQSKLAVTIEGLVFPEFFKQRVFDKVEARVFHNECRYDAIIGRDVLTEMGIVLDFKNQSVKWDDCIVDMKPFPDRNTTKMGIKDPTAGEQLYLDSLEADLEDDHTLPTCCM